MKNLMPKFNKNFILMMSLLLSLTVIMSSCDDDEVTTTPVVPSVVIASFTSQVDADNSLTYTFDNETVVNNIADGSFTSSWDFGGDGTSTEESPVFTFSSEGTFDVTLTVTATDGEVGSVTNTVEVTAPVNRFAEITDSTDGDTGELRLAVDSIQSGSISFVYRVAEGPGMDIQDGFINVTGTSTSGRNSIVEVRLKDDAPNEFREGASDATIAAANFNEGMANVWIPVEISWTSDGVNTPLYTVIIDGQTVITDAPSTTRDPNDADQVAEHLATTIDGAANFQWKYAGQSAISDGVYQVDDIVIVSLDSGSPVVVFEDNFQGFTTGDNLDPADADGNVINAESVYHPNSFDVVVADDL